MEVFQMSYERLGLWSHTDLAYIRQDAALQPFIAYPPNASSFVDTIQHRKSFPADRTLLYQVLQKQYDALGIPLPVSEAQLLDENTFTVATAHQPSLLTGPLYNIYKIASTIHLAGQLSELHPEQNILPVFIMSGEDHDWEEINHVHLFGKKYTWDRAATGPCGRLSLEGLDTLLELVSELFVHTPYGKDIREMLYRSLKTANRYSDFHHLLLHHLFSRFGLIILSMDDPDLKRAFIPSMEKELRERFSFHHVPETQSKLEAAGFKAQAYCRLVNLFYMTDDARERIEPSDTGFLRVESGISMSEVDIMIELHDHPERFSPNVVLRPLYQEFTLPNLAYVGGGGELAYWLERKSQFEAAGVHYPVLIRRNSLLYIDAGTASQIRKADLLWEDLLDEYDAIVRAYILRHSQTELSFEAELEQIRSAYAQLADKAEKLDPTLSKAILAEETKQLKQFEQLGSRLMRTEKQLHETQIKRIQKLKEKLFPEGGLQERHENFLAFYSQSGPAWIDTIVRMADPLIGKFTVVVQEG